MISFDCPGCHETLEGDDAIRGTRMACPGCGKPIDVPWEEKKAAPRSGTAPRRSGDRPRRVRGGGGGPPYWLFGVGAGVVIVLGLLLVLYGLDRTKRPPPVHRSSCPSCNSTGRASCSACAGSKLEACPNKECVNGKITNFRGEEEPCLQCNGTRSIPCRTCGGSGYFSCTSCQGRGFRTD